MTKIVEEKLKLLPDAPGVYIMRNDKGKVIYVGKARVLKNRVRQYFHGSHAPKVAAMVSHVEDFETIITGSEIEALILECNLIKKYRPRYNISLKDDKTYPYLKVTLGEDFPRVLITRRVEKDGSRYFGPYTSGLAMQESLKLLRKLFPLRTCKRLQARPCLEHHIRRCLAPCAGKVSKEEYAGIIRAALLFLEGRTDEVEKELTYRMEKAAESYNFELAASLRDQLAAVRKFAEKQSIVTGAGDADALGLARLGKSVCVQVFPLREGKIMGRSHFFLRGSEEEKDEDILTAFIEQYYHRTDVAAQEILLPLEISAEERELLEKWLTRERGGQVHLVTPKRGTKRDIVELAERNAEKFLADEEARREREEKSTLGAVKELGRYLGLKNPPNRMECFDISHIQGSETVASMVVFEGGAPKKSDYRRFKIRSTEGKPDDFLSMREVTRRRYVGLDSEELPDLIVIDGGKGQLSSALEIIRGEAGHMEVPVVGLAKQFELIFTEGESEPVELPRDSQALFLIERIRDEAHRFAITYHRKLRGKRNLTSVLDHIEGIGEKRRAALWAHFGTLDKIEAASLEELLAAPSMNYPAAEAVYNFFLAKKERKDPNGGKENH